MLSGISLLLACGLTLNNAVSMPETATVSETQSVYSENIYTPPAIHFVSDGRDIYESNDGFNVATPLSPETLINSPLTTPNSPRRSILSMNSSMSITMFLLYMSILMSGCP